MQPETKRAVMALLIAVIGIVGGAFAVSEALLVPAALLVDGAMFAWSYDQPRRLVVGMTVIHAVITTLLGIVLVGITVLLSTMPG